MPGKKRRAGSDGWLWEGSFFECTDPLGVGSL